MPESEGQLNDILTFQMLLVTFKYYLSRIKIEKRKSATRVEIQFNSLKNDDFDDNRVVSMFIVR